MPKIDKDVLLQEVASNYFENLRSLHKYADYTPDELNELYLSCFEKNHMAINHIPKPSRTSDMCLKAIIMTGGEFTLAKIDKKNLTDEICLAMIKFNIGSVDNSPAAYVPRLCPRHPFALIIGKFLHTGRAIQG